MRVLLDTYVALWWYTDSELLSKGCQEVRGYQQYYIL